MFLDLWNLLVLISEIVDWTEQGSISCSAFILTFGFGAVVYLAWISTNIRDLPSIRNSPYVIRIQDNINNVNRDSLSRQRVADVRLTNVSGVDQVFHQLSTRVHQQNHHQVTTGHRSTLLFGLLHPASRPLLHFRPSSSRSRFQPSNVLVYHQVNLYENTSRNQDSSSTVYNDSLSVNIQRIRQDNDATAVAVQNSHSEFVASDASDSSFMTTSDLSSPEDHSDRQSCSTDRTRLQNNSVIKSGESDLNVVQVNIEEITSNTNTIGLSAACNATVLEQSASPSIELNRAKDTTQAIMNTCNEKQLNHQRTACTPCDENVRITMKFLNDTQMEVRTRLNEKIADFKRSHFNTELSENKTIRLIFNGRMLDNDDSTLEEAGIFDQCVVHCLIVTLSNGPRTVDGQGSSAESQTRRSTARDGLEPGMFFVTILGIVLVFLWFVCFHFGQQLFTQSAVASLVVLTAVFVIGLVALYLPVQT